MPPKPTKAALVEDTSPVTYLEVAIGCSIQLEAKADGSPLPPLVLAATIAPDPEALRSAAVAPDADGNYSVSLASTVVRRSGEALLHQLLNTPVLVNLCRVDTGEVMAGATLDLLPMGQGASEVAVDSLPLNTAASAGPDAPGSAFTTLPIAAAKVSLLRLREGAPEPAPPAAAPSRPGKAKDTEPVPIPPPADLEPAPLLSAAESEGSQVVELAVLQAGALPAGLGPAMQAAGNALAFSCCLSIPAMAGNKAHHLVCPGGLLKDEQLSWGTRPIRFWLPAAALTSLKALCDSRTALPVELARYLLPGNDTISDPAYEAYHGFGLAEVAEQLLAPGQAAAECQVACTSFLDAKQAGHVLGPALPPPEQPTNPKAKPIEEVASGGEVGAPPCAWQQADTRLRLTLRLSQSFFPAWQPPPAPTQTLAQLIPNRSRAKKVDPVGGTQDYRAQVQAIARSLAAEYVKVESIGDATTRQADLVFELNRSGMYLAMKERLKRCVVAVVRERHRKGAKPERDDMQVCYNELFVYLMAEMHKALLDLAPLSCPPPAPPPPDAARLAHLLELAGEAEVCGDHPAATRCHEERLLAATNPQVWYESGTFCLRTQQLGAAEENLREALSLDAQHHASLLALACLLWSNARTTDPAFFQAAEVLLHSARGQSPASALVWALQGLVYLSQGDRRTTEARNSCFEARRLARADAACRHGNAFLQAALLALDLHLGDCAQQALQQAISPPDSTPGLAGELALCSSRAASLVGDEAAALAYAKEALRGLEAADIRPHIMLGDIHYQAGRRGEASTAYQAALRLQPEACPLEVYLRLGAAFLEQAQPEYARNVYVQACAVRPCASSWMGAGLAHLRMGDLANADLALTEANLLDPSNARIWGYLALRALRAGQTAEAEQAMAWAHKQGLADAGLLAEIGSCYLEQGRYSQACEVLRRSLAHSPLPPTRCLLSEALLQQQELAGAAEQLDCLLKDDSTTPAQRQLALQHLVDIHRRMGNEGQLAAAIAQLAAM